MRGRSKAVLCAGGWGGWRAVAGGWGRGTFRGRRRDPGAPGKTCFTLGRLEERKGKVSVSESRGLCSVLREAVCLKEGLLQGFYLIPCLHPPLPWVLPSPINYSSLSFTGHQANQIP